MIQGVGVTKRGHIERKDLDIERYAKASQYQLIIHKESKCSTQGTSLSRYSWSSGYNVKSNTNPFSSATSHVQCPAVKEPGIVIMVLPLLIMGIKK